MSFDPNFITPPGAKIKVIGVGGGGGNAVNTMIRSGLEGVDFITANTDVQALRFSLAEQKLQVGRELTRGLGAGADPDVGRDAALEDRYEIQQALAGADMVFITAGMGGGTGTGGAAVVAQIARELGALTVAVVTKPFGFEGKRRRKHAEIGISRLRECVDTLITIPNQRLLQVASPSLSMIDAFKMADDVLVNAVRGISDIINIPGRVNVDFADVKTVMSCMGQALMGIGAASGDQRAAEAARMAISSPLLEDIDIEGATGILINITAGSEVTLMEVNEACSIVQEAAHEDANIIFGAVIDETLGGQMRVTVIATGFPVDKEETDISNVNIPKSQPVQSPFGSRLTTSTSTFGIDTKSPTNDPVIATSENHTTAPVVVPPSVLLKSDINVEIEPKFSAHAPIHQVDAYPSEASDQKTPSLSLGLTATDEARQLAAWTFDLAEVPSLQSAAAETEISHEHSAEIVGPGFAGQMEEEFFLESNGYSTHFTPEIVVTTHDVLNIDSLESLESGVSLSNAPNYLSEVLDRTVVQSIDANDYRPGAVKGAVAEVSSFGSEGLDVVAEIDKKIDASLELAERMRTPQRMGETDNLEVPAFLRQGMRDLPLD